MRIKQALILLLSLVKLSLFGQTDTKTKDTVIVAFKNVSTKEFTQYHMVINGQEVIGKNLLPNHSRKIKIATKGNNIFRFTMYTDKALQERYSIEPMDYSSQVSKMKFVYGHYIYLINIKEEEGGFLDIKLKKTD
jgi:hypothetical protein